MIKRLRKRFLLMAMLSTTLVLSIIIGVINVANYVNINQELDVRMFLISNNGGFFPDIPEFKEDQGPNGYGGPNDIDLRGISKESPFDTRYFSVSIDETGTISFINTGMIALVSETEAASMALDLYHKNKTEGFIDNFKYKAITADGITNYTFLYCEKERTTFRNFLLASVGTSIGGLIVVFILLWFSSKVILRPVAESYEKQKRFITDASHELKTPLTVIDANVEVMEMLDGENEWTTSTRNQVKRLASLTEKLVLLSRMDEENTKIEHLDFDLSEAVLDSVEPFQAVAKTKGKTLSVDVCEKLRINGDEKLMRQLLSLLVDNAIKYSNENGQISVSLKPSGKGVELSVYNTVEQIPVGKLDYLFDRFYRMDESRNTKTGGFGIGLSVAQAIVNAHKGTISAKSMDGKSIIFTINI